MAIMFDHAVKYNGKYYPANTLIEEAKPEKAKVTVEAKAETTKSRKKGDAR